MGTLVFQATLGGQVNLSGPNTASTFTISVPAVTGNMITSGDTGTVTNTMLAGSIANAKLTNSSVTIGSTSVALGATAATIAGLTLTAPVLGTPTSVTLTNGTGLPLTTGVTGTLPTANGGTGLTSFTANGVVYASSTSALATGSALTFDGSYFIAASGTGTFLSDVVQVSGTATKVNANGIGLEFRGSATPNISAYNRVTSAYLPMTLDTSASIFSISGSEQMRLTSTGLVLGNSSAISGGKISALVDLTAVNGLVIRDSATTYANNDNYVLLQNSTGATAGGLTHPASASLGVWGNDDIRFLQGSGATEGMRLTSTGLGIGTTSTPTSKLEVIAPSTSFTSPQMLVGNSSSQTTGQQLWLGYNTTAGAGYIQSVFNGTAYTSLVINPNGGNLGLGVTPSAWAAAYKALQFGNFTSISSYASTDALELCSNAYAYGNDTWKYLDTYSAARIEIGNGSHKFFVAPAGTAGNPITFTQAMTLDASGNLGIGETSIASKLAVTASLPYATVTGSGSGQYGFQLKAGSTDSAGTLVGGLTYNSATGENRILGPQSYNFLTMYAGGSERARIDSSGNLLVAKTASSDTTVGLNFYANGAATSTLAASTNVATSWATYSTGAGAYRFYVDMGGTIHATSIVITAISDQRLKENVRDIDTGLAAIMAIKPRRFDWKEGKGQDKKNAAGFIAQEFGEVFPASLSTSKAGGDGIEYITMNHEELIPSMVKAIQEQQVLIESLTARLAAANI